MVPLPSHLTLSLLESNHMAARNFGNELKVAQPGLTALFLKGAGGGADTNFTLTYGLGFNPTVAQQGASGSGVYNITLTDNWAALIFTSFNVIDTGTIDDWEVIVDVDLTTKVVAIQVFKGGVAADLPTTATLMGVMVLLDSAALPVKGA